MASKLVRFDWATKHLLRNKANFSVLEGFLSVLLNEKVTIVQILSSQSNKETDDAKYNDVDILVENIKGELIIVEVQNNKEYDYFHRILFGTSKAVVEYVKEGKPYSDIKKVISVTIAYFDLGQGEDYVYHGKTHFKGIHKGDTLTLSDKQKVLINKQQVSDIYPEYWIIKAGIFNEEKVTDKLDEWIYFFKTGEVKEEFTAMGLLEAKDKLDKLKLTPEEKRDYDEFVSRLRRIASYQQTEMIDALDLIEKTKIEGKIEGKIEALNAFVIELWSDDTSIERIEKYTKISAGEILQIIENYKNKP